MTGWALWERHYLNVPESTQYIMARRSVPSLLISQRLRHLKTFLFLSLSFSFILFQKKKKREAERGREEEKKLSDFLEFICACLCW